MQFHMLALFSGISPLISSSEKSFPSSCAKPFTESTALPRYDVSRFSFSNTLRLTANEKDRGLRSG